MISPSRLSPPSPKNASRANERGNVFLIVIVGVVLFAALMFTLSRGMNEAPDGLSRRQAGLFASEVLGTGQKLERGVNTLRRRGCSQDDISFYSTLWSTPADYDNANNSFADADANDSFSCFVFHPQGAAISLHPPPPQATQGGNWGVFGTIANTSVGQTADSELALILTNLKPAVCEAINRHLGLPETPAQGSADPLDLSTPFAGVFSTEDTLGVTTPAHAGKNAFCFQDGADGALHYFHVLVAR